MMAKADRLDTGDVLPLLHYICPPSSLAPIPAHLLSRPLLQRHFFLAISTHTPLDYLTWPPDQSDDLLPLLESIKPDDLSHLLSVRDPSVHYTADPESLYAHFLFSPTQLPHPHSRSVQYLRIVFLWDPHSASWRYHNIATSPFPKDSHPDLARAMALFQSPDDFLPDRDYAFSNDDEHDDNSYWDAYGTPGDHLLSSHPVKPSITTDPEDAYWARYASVQGSADSTIPSPRSQGRKLQPHDTEPDQRVFVPSSELDLGRSSHEIYNPLSPPSPGSLSRRLAVLPSRPDSPPLQEEDDNSTSSVISPSPQSPQTDFTEDLSAIPHAAITQVHPAHSSTADEALKATIRGLYQLWQCGSTTQQDFLVLVQQALYGQV